MNKIKPNEIKIKPVGFYFEIDEDGFIINPASIDKIQKKWRIVIDDIVNAYKKAYGEHLHSIYVRGSVVKGGAIDYVSDIDTFAFVDLSKKEIRYDRIDKFEKEFINKYDFVNGIEIEAYPLSHIKKDLIILNQSVIVWGEKINIPKIKVGKNLAIHSQNFQKRIDWFGKFLVENESDDEVKKGCVWLMKGLLRVGFEITMERSQKYTRDLYPCYETFSEYYPEKELQMREVLRLALNPTADKKEIKKIMNNLGDWLLGEIKKISNFD